MIAGFARAPRRGAVAACLFSSLVLACGLTSGFARAADVAPGIEGLPASAPAVQPGSIVRFPAAPPADDSALVEVPMPAGSDLRFMVDPGSVGRAQIGLVRYTLVVRSPSGYRNISYEGLDCTHDRWHVYATWSAADGRWQANPGDTWLRANVKSNSDVHGVLDRDYWCQGRWAAGDAGVLVKRLRQGVRPQFVRP